MPDHSFELTILALNTILGLAIYLLLLFTREPKRGPLIYPDEPVRTRDGRRVDDLVYRAGSAMPFPGTVAGLPFRWHADGRVVQGTWGSIDDTPQGAARGIRYMLEHGGPDNMWAQIYGRAPYTCAVPS